MIISRVSDQNGTSLQWCIVEIYHSGRKHSICLISCDLKNSLSGLVNESASSDVDLKCDDFTHSVQDYYSRSSRPPSRSDRDPYRQGYSGYGSGYGSYGGGYYDQYQYQYPYYNYPQQYGEQQQQLQSGGNDDDDSGDNNDNINSNNDIER